MEFLGFSFVLDSNNWFIIGSRFNFKGPEFDVFLNNRFIELPTDQSFSVEDGVERVLGSLIFCGITD